MKLIAYDDASVFDTLQPEWNELLKRSNCDLIFLSWEWQATWWETYRSENALWVVAVRDDSDRLVAIAPWFVEHKDGERVVRTVGCVDVTDYVDIIAEPQHAREAFQLLAEHLEEQNARYDRVNLCNIPEESPTRTEFSDMLARLGFEVEIEFQEVCPVIPLPRQFEDYVNQLDKKNRHELRRKIRRAESEPSLDWYIVGAEHDIDAEIKKFLGLMAASHPAKAEFLSDPSNVEFFNRITRLAYERGWLQLAFLSCHGKVIASYLNFDYGGRILVYNSGLLPEEYGYLSPGIVLLAYLIDHAIKSERYVFDFLRGNENYKYRMGAIDTRVYKLKARLPKAA